MQGYAQEICWTHTTSLTVWPYCMGGCSGQNKRIINVQKRAIRTVSKSYVTSHTEPRMKAMGILKLEELYKQQCTTFIHDVMNNRAPAPIKHLIALGRGTTRINLGSHNSDPNHIRIPTSRSKFGSNSFSSKGPLFWNDLPQQIQDIKEKHIFKFRLKQLLLTTYSDTTVCNNPRCTDRQHHH